MIGHSEIHRVTIGHNLGIGDVFNVYGPESTKRGAAWRGGIKESLASFLLIDTARRLAQLSSLHPDEDWNDISVRLESEGFDLSDPGVQSPHCPCP